MARRIPLDLEILRFIGRVKIARPEQIVTRFGVHRATAYRRLALLVEDGLLTSSPRITNDGLVFFATGAGLSAGQLALPVATPSIAIGAHDIAAGDVVASLESRGIDCVTEREMRFHQRAEGDGRYLFDVDDHTAGRRVRHLADIACEIPKADHFLAIEVELVPKTATRWRDTLDGFKNRIDVAGFAGVLYLCGENARASNLNRISREVGVDRRLRVLSVDDDPLIGLHELIDAMP